MRIQGRKWLIESWWLYIQKDYWKSVKICEQEKKDCQLTYWECN